MLWDQLMEWIKGFYYAARPKRLMIQRNGILIFRGHHRVHVITPSTDGLICDCETFWRFLPWGGWCRHTVAIQRILTAVDAGTAMVCEGELVH